MKEMYAYRSDCNVIRNMENRPGMAVLMDCDGNELFTVPDDWTDEQVLMALDFANGAFRHGKKIGKQEKIDKVKRALDLWHDTFG